MSERRNLAAFTLPNGSLPPYVSVNFVPAFTAGGFAASVAIVTIDVRGHAVERMGTMVEGPTARVVMTPDEYRAWLRDMVVRSVAEGLL